MPYASLVSSYYWSFINSGRWAWGQYYSMPATLLIIGAALNWAIGNIIYKHVERSEVFGLVIWAATIPPLPFFILFLRMTWVGFSSLIYLAIISSGPGHILWGRLLSHYPAGKVPPFSLLVPVVSLILASLFVAEKLSYSQWIGTLIVMVASALITFGEKAINW